MNLTVNTNEHREPEQQSTRSGSSRCSSPASSSSSSSPGRTRRGGRGRGRNRHNHNHNHNRNRQSSPRSVAAPASPSSSSFFFGNDEASSPSPTHLAKYSRRANPLVPPSPPHDAPMTKADIYFAMDCEMVGVGSDGTSNALARVVLVNYDEAVVFDKYVRVSQPVTDYRTFVSGITAADLDGALNPAAVSFAECRAEVRRILHGKILIGHGLSSDLAALDMSHPWSDVRDTAQYAPFMRRVHSKDVRQDVLLPSKLRDLVWDKCQMQIQHLGQSHDPKEDAVAALRLYKSARKEWEVDMIRQVKAARELEEATVRRAARRQQRVQQRVHQRQQQQQQQQQQQHQQQHQHMMPAMSPQYSNHGNVNVNRSADVTTNCKPSVNTVHQSGGRSLSPQMMPVHAPPMSPPPLMVQQSVQPMQPPPVHTHMAHPPGLGLPAMDHGYGQHQHQHQQYQYQHQQRGQARNANDNSGAGAYPRHRLQSHA